MSDTLFGEVDKPLLTKKYTTHHRLKTVYAIDIEYDRYQDTRDLGNR